MSQCNSLEDYVSEILLGAFKINNSATNGRDGIGVHDKRCEIKGQDGNVDLVPLGRVQSWIIMKSHLQKAWQV